MRSSTLSVALLLVACSAFQQEDAEALAVSFVREHVIPVTSGEREGVPFYDISVVSATRQGDEWLLTVQLSAMVNGSTKSSLVGVTVDGDSRLVTSFNGAPVP